MALGYTGCDFLGSFLSPRLTDHVESRDGVYNVTLCFAV